MFHCFAHLGATRRIAGVKRGGWGRDQRMMVIRINPLGRRRLDGPDRKKGRHKC